MKNLKEYKSKRNFSKTSEPKGKILQKTRKKRVFVVQFHRASHEHFDFRLEWNGVLLSWAVPKGPSFNPKDKRLAVAVEDHPLEYANFEGNIPKGEYGGGSVMVWDKGFWQENEDFETGLEKGSLKFHLEGQRLKGNWALVRLKDKKNWLLIKEKDEFAKNSAGISKFKTSVISGKTSENIENLAKNPFKSASVQLCKLSNKVPKGEDWIYEIKYDGFRILAYVENDEVRLISRNGRDFTHKFQNVAKDLQKFGKVMVLDGEMTVSDENGKSDFQALQNYLKTNENSPVFVVFDILALDGKDLRDEPLEKRKKILKETIKNTQKSVILADFLKKDGEKCFKAVQKAGLEGIVAKRLSSKYSGERSEDWIKVKCYKSDEFVIVGYTSKKKDISSLVLAQLKNGELIFCGKVGTGIDNLWQKELKKKLKIAKKPPFSRVFRLEKDEKLFWVKPKYVAEIQFSEWTDENVLRQPSFKGLREDKDKSDLNSDETFVAGVKISSPERVVFPGNNITKKMVAQYYHKVSEKMLPFVKDRVLSVVRVHENVNKDKFFSKHPSTMTDGMEIVPIINDEGEKSDYFCIKNEAGLLSQVQLGTIEFHPWGSTVKNLDKPDVMVFDLDPDENLPLHKVRQGVKDLKSVLDELGLVSFLKTSGGKGYHVVVPFVPKVNFETFHDFAENVAIFMENKWPDRYTQNIRKDSREGKIFIDYARNAKGSTSVAPYSLRARDGAKVSMPIFWEELSKIKPDGVDIKSALKKIDKDPWKDFFKVKQTLKKQKFD